MTYLERHGDRTPILVYLGTSPLAHSVRENAHRVNAHIVVLAMREEYSRCYRHTVERQQLIYSSITVWGYVVQIYQTRTLLAPCDQR